MKSVHKWGGALLVVGVQLAIAMPALATTLRFGETAVREIEYLSTNLAGRSSGSQREWQTGDYLFGRLQSFGYTPTRQPFIYHWDGRTYTSSNIIAERLGRSGKQIIIGAHYDTAPSQWGVDRSTLQGTNDNASGVGVLLELAQRLEAETQHTIKFLLFGAEEVGLKGAHHYASRMSQEDIQNTLVMINLDSLVLGDKMYFNAGRLTQERPEFGVFRDRALDIASRLGIAAETNPGLNAFYPRGIGCCSDQEAFDLSVPVLAVEATNWEIGNRDGYTQTSHPLVPGGKTWHNPATDNLMFIEQVFPGLIRRRSRDFTRVLDALIDDLNATTQITTTVPPSPPPVVVTPPIVIQTPPVLPNSAVPEPATVLGTLGAAIGVGLFRKRQLKKC